MDLLALAGLFSIPGILACSDDLRSSSSESPSHRAVPSHGYCRIARSGGKHKRPPLPVGQLLYMLGCQHPDVETKETGELHSDFSIVDRLTQHKMLDKVTVPAGVAAGGQFQANTPSGLMLVTVPPSVKSRGGTPSRLSRRRRRRRRWPWCERSQRPSRKFCRGPCTHAERHPNTPLIPPPPNIHAHDHMQTSHTLPNAHRRTESFRFTIMPPTMIMQPPQPPLLTSAPQASRCPASPARA